MRCFAEIAFKNYNFQKVTNAGKHLLHHGRQGARSGARLRQRQAGGPDASEGRLRAHIRIVRWQ